MKINKFYLLALPLVLFVLVESGCSSTPAPEQATPPDSGSLDFSSSTVVMSAPTTTARVGSALFRLETLTSPDGSVENFVVYKNDMKWKTLPVGLGETGITIFKQTKKYLYLGPQIDGLGGYILYEALPNRIVQFDPTSGGFAIFSFGGVAEDITPDDRFQLWITAGQGSLAFSVFDTAPRTQATKATQTFPVAKGYTQAGNARFSPDGKRFAYAAAFGIPDRDGGAIFMVDLATKKQTKLAESPKPNQIPHIRGWKTVSTPDYYFE